VTPALSFGHCFTPHLARKEPGNTTAAHLSQQERLPESRSRLISRIRQVSGAGKATHSGWSAAADLESPSPPAALKAVGNSTC
jgi:hypothetical protein